MARVTVADVNRVAQTYFKTHNRSVGEFVPLEAPARVDVPGRADMAATLAALPAQSTVAPGEAFDASPANIEARTEKSKLANGLEIALLPKKTRGETVQFSFTIRVGDAENLRGQAVVLNLASAMLLNGSVQHNRAAIAAELERLGSRLSVRQLGQSIIVTADTRRQQAADVLKLMRDVLREPAFPEDELTRMVRQRVAIAKDNALQPPTLATRALTRHLTPYPADDVRYAPDAVEYQQTAEKVDREQLADFWRDYVGGEHAWFAAVGDFDAQAITSLMTTYFGDWASTQRYASLPEPWQDILPLTQLIEAPDKQNASLQGGVRINAGERQADYPALLIATRLIGGGFLSSRLATRIRQNEGLSYNVGASLMTNTGSANSVLYLSAIYAPQNRARLEVAVREEFERLYRDGFSEAELSDAKNALLESRRLARAQDATLAEQLVSNLRLKRAFTYAAEFDARLAGLRLEELNAVVRKYLDPAKLSLVFAGDFARSAALKMTAQ